MAPHGVSGPINIVYPPVLIGTALNIIGAEKTLGIPQKEEQASGDIVGGVWQPMASRPQDKFSRSFSKREYYDPVRDRPNLHFLAENTVTKILFDKKKTTGVTVSDHSFRAVVLYEAPVREPRQIGRCKQTHPEMLTISPLNSTPRDQKLRPKPHRSVRRAR